jgi:hypothetical protein
MSQRLSVRDHYLCGATCGVSVPLLVFCGHEVQGGKLAKTTQPGLYNYIYSSAAARAQLRVSG